jgi:CHAT domain-containing protein
MEIGGRTNLSLVKFEGMMLFVSPECSQCSPALQKSTSPCRLWWCPTGPFSFLPIHAAGIYDTKGTESVFDYVVSSYTPSLKSLLSDHPPINEQYKVAVIIQPDAPNHGCLPDTEKELRNIEKHVPSHSLIRLGVKNNPATVHDVLFHLPRSHIVHFACHGDQNANDPLESCLILHDGKPLKVKEIMAQPMPNALLAFLCACETAMGAEKLPDEAMHIAASLLFAGFRGVVATMWSVLFPHSFAPYQL